MSDSTMDNFFRASMEVNRLSQECHEEREQLRADRDRLQAQLDAERRGAIAQGDELARVREGVRELVEAVEAERERAKYWDGYSPDALERLNAAQDKTDALVARLAPDALTDEPISEAALLREGWTKKELGGAINGHYFAKKIDDLRQIEVWPDGDGYSVVIDRRAGEDYYDKGWTCALNNCHTMQRLGWLGRLFGEGK